MLELIYLVGCPASGKSTYARELLSNNPGKYKRINNDLIRECLDFSSYSKTNESFVEKIRNNLIRNSLQEGYSVIVDNVNSVNKHFNNGVKIAKSLNIDCKVFEIPFYIDLQTAIERDSKRTGIACVGEKVIARFFKELGGENFKNYSPKEVLLYRQEPAIMDGNNERAIISDLDGTLAIIGNRNPFDAAICDIVDTPNEAISEIIKMHYKAGYKILFCSGRQDKDREPTERFIKKHLPGIRYELFMRKTADYRSDDVVKEEIFNNYIKNNYNVKLVLDDRLSVCRLWDKLGLNLLRAGKPDRDDF